MYLYFSLSMVTQTPIQPRVYNWACKVVSPTCLYSCSVTQFAAISQRNHVSCKLFAFHYQLNSDQQQQHQLPKQASEVDNDQRQLQCNEIQGRTIFRLSNYAVRAYVYTYVWICQRRSISSSASQAGCHHALWHATDSKLSTCKRLWIL